MLGRLPGCARYRHCRRKCDGNLSRRALAVGYGICGQGSSAPWSRAACSVRAICNWRMTEEIEEALRGAKRVIADPLYKPIVPAKSEFYPLPHEAFSGRIYRKQIPNLAERV